jgi:hypothetical protein
MAKTKVEKPAVEIIKDTCKLFKTFGVTSITATYDGSGDSGSIDDINLHYGDPRVITSDTRTQQFWQFVSEKIDAVPVAQQIFTKKLSDAFENALWKLLTDNFGGWENDDGASGDIDIDVQTGKIEVEHNQRYTEVNTTSREF